MVRLKVKEVAESKGVSQRQLSLRTGIDINTIRRMFRYPALANPRVATLGKVARVLNVDISKLVEGMADE